MDITHTISIAICDDHQGIHDIVEVVSQDSF